AGDAEDDRRRPGFPPVRRRDQDDENRQENEAADGERVRKVSAHHAARIRGVRPLALPGFVDAHCHAFQRALRGRSGGGDFWAWREQMLAEAGRQTPALVRQEYVLVYRELLAAGYTAVGEFHYLGLDEAFAAAEAADEAGITLVVLVTAYGRGGLDRFRQASSADYLRQVEKLRAA